MTNSFQNLIKCNMYGCCNWITNVTIRSNTSVPLYVCRSHMIKRKDGALEIRNEYKHLPLIIMPGDSYPLPTDNTWYKKEDIPIANPSQDDLWETLRDNK